MKRIFLLILVVVFTSPLFSQKIENIYFHLYTDSLKKGQNNYINVDAKMSNGNWLPLTSKDIIFSCNKASFEGNELIIPENFKEEKLVVKAVLKDNPAISIEKTIWIKTVPDPELPEPNDNGKRKGKNKD